MNVTMTYSIKNLTSGRMLSDPLTCKPHTFGAYEDARVFMESCKANNTSDHVRNGRRICRYQIFERWESDVIG
jgi:hypothetical protein